jgi:transcriptional regulator with XRE-family HTH domain
MTASALGRKLRALRKLKGLTLDELARETGSSKSYIWELENKPVARPSAEKIGKIAAVLDVTPEYLIDEKRTKATVDDRDKAFFRKYEAADETVKEQLKRILDLLDK